MKTPSRGIGATASEPPDMMLHAPARRAGMAAIGLSAALFPLHTAWAALPLGIFIALCGAASLYPRSRFFLPVISRGRTGQNAVALTFDDGPDPLTTPHLLGLLAKYDVKATFFVSGQAAERHPEWIESMLLQGHLIGNHSYSHTPCLMLHRYGRLYREIESAQQVLCRFGVLPLAFRPPVGLTNPKLGPVLSKLGMICVTFSCRAYDRGNRHVRGMALKILGKVRSDDIILLHDVRPPGAADVDGWLGEVDAVLNGLGQRDISVLPLDVLIGRPVMRPCREEGS